MPNRHRQAAEALRKGLEVLARKQRRRHDHRHLPAIEGRDERGAQGDFRLAEPDIAADQPVHRRACAKIVDHRFDGGKLILGLVIGKARDEFVIDAFGRQQALRRLHGALGRDPDKLTRHLEDALLHARLARLPGYAAELVELHLGIGRAVARQQFDILDRQEKLVVTGIAQFKAIMRRAGCGDRLEADKAGDAVLHVDDDVAFRQRRRLGNDVACLALAGGAAHQPVAKDILFGDEGEARQREALLHRQDGKRRASFLERSDLREAVDRRKTIHIVFGQHLPHAVARAGGPRCYDDALALFPLVRRMVRHRLENVGAGRAFIGEAAALAALQVDDPAAGRIGRHEGRNDRRLQRRQTRLRVRVAANTACPARPACTACRRRMAGQAPPCGPRSDRRPGRSAPSRLPRGGSR